MSTSFRTASPAGAALLLVGALSLSACDGSERRNPEPGNITAPAEADAPTLRLPEAIPTPAPKLDRTALLLAVARAASAHAAGQDDRADQKNLAGRRFTLKIRFGCGGPVTDASRAMAWTYDKKEQRLSLRATPDITADTPALGDLAKSIEAVEGFWIPRPWLLTDTCPADAAAGAEGAVASRPTVGIAQYFTAEHSRVPRRSERSYEIVRRAEPPIAPPSTGFNLVLEGRLTPWPEAGVIRCRGSGHDTRPVCIISVELDRVAFENPESGQTLAEWGAG